MIKHCRKPQSVARVDCCHVWASSGFPLYFLKFVYIMDEKFNQLLTGYVCKNLYIYLAQYTRCSAGMFSRDPSYTLENMLLDPIYMILK